MAKANFTGKVAIDTLEVTSMTSAMVMERCTGQTVPYTRDNGSKASIMELERFIYQMER